MLKLKKKIKKKMNLCVLTEGDWYTGNECIMEWFFFLAPLGKSNSLAFPGRKIKPVPPNSDLSLASLPLNLSVQLLKGGDK